MKKIIALILLIVIPFGLIISESSKKPLIDRVEKDGYSLQAKDSLWEYVKYEVGQGRVNLKTNYAEKYQEPILVTLENATEKDSLAIKEVMKELRKVFSLKKVAYFSDFVGQNYVPINKDNASYDNGYTYDELVSFTTKFSFEIDLIGTSSGTSSFYLEDRNMNTKYDRNNKWNEFFLESELFLGIRDKVSIEDRASFITSKYYNLMWNTFISKTEEVRKDFRKNQDWYFQYKNKIEFVKGKYHIKDQEFLIKKIFSEDFKKQFENYMYKTYPWRYANHVIDKEKAKQNASAIVAFVGLLILILSCSLFWNRKFEGSFSSYFWAVLIYSVGFSSLQTLHAYLIYINYPTNALVGVVLSLLIEVLLVLVLSFLFWQLEKRIVPRKGSFGYQLLVKLGLTFLVLYFPYMLMTYYYESIVSSGGKITRSLNDLQFLFIVVGLTMGRGVLLYLNHFSESLIKQKDVELSQLKEVNAQAEVKLLQSQINPHFLYNALNSIATLARKDGEKAEQMALSLSDLFKYTINRKGKKNSTIRDEVEMVQNYLEIEQIRFGDRLQFSIEVPKELESVKIPMFIIQPLIENAVKHGISKNEGYGEIALKIEKSTNGIEIVVEDNGSDFPDGLVSGHGLQTVYDLLRLSYGEEASMNWQNEPQKRITIQIVQKIKEKNS